MLRNRSLAGLVTAELVSLTGSSMTFVALPWFVLATTGATQLTQLVGPVLAGVLIAATSAATALVVDGATYVFSFVTIALVVRAGKRIEATERSKGVLAGLKFLMADSLLGPLMIAACV